MRYELHWFDQLIDNGLQPLHDNVKKSSLWQNHLHEPSFLITKQFTLVGSLDQSNIFSIRTTKTRLLVNRTIIPGIDSTSNPLDEPTTASIISQIERPLSIQGSEVSYAYHWQSEIDTHLELYVQQEIEQLTPEEQRFSYYLHQLEEQTQAVKHRLTDTVFRLSSGKKANKYIQDHQRMLTSLCNAVVENLSEEERQHIYCLSDEFSVSDIYKMVFRSLEDIIAHLEQHFTQYLDTAAYVSYRSRIISFARMVERFSSVQQALQQSTIASGLLDTLKEPFQKLQSIKTSPTTYLELLYYKKLIREVGCLAEQDRLSDYALTEALFRINFNSFGFFDMVNRLSGHACKS